MDTPTSRHPPIAVHAYPLVPASPPFPFLAGPPIDHASGKVGTIDPHLRSANNLAYTRTLELLRRELGPHFPLEKLWEKHTYYEFVERDAPKTMSTMVATPYVNHVPTMTGGVGYQDLARFYKYHFTKENVTPPDTELITISRTVGADRIIDEMIFKCTHTTEVDYFLPGIKPTGKPLEIALVGVVAFRGDKLTFEHIYWDQASLLVQLGLLDPKGLPVAGVEVARKVVDPFGLPSNTLMAKWKESEGLAID
ncbi:NTF2-like protein [Trametes coccinea BRFM310]|uniref:NTF2-like protein n=1 Tax=Trametes coccinea (strain BRFM310) TaxID=1353009 RepID=A0A1Y2IEC9_TRAC3|nr:NTF2-like protein [Trametes coccinea BRFM310]